VAKTPDPIHPATEEAVIALKRYADLKAEEAKIKAAVREQGAKVRAMMPKPGVPVVLPTGEKIKLQAGRVTMNAELLLEELPELYQRVSTPAVDQKKFEAAAEVMGLAEGVVNRYRQVGDPYLVVTRPKS